MQLLLILLLPFNSHFPGWTWVIQFPLCPSPPSISEENFWKLVEWVFLWAGCPFCHPTFSLKALRGTKSTNPNQWPGLKLSSSTTRLLMEGVLLPLHQLSNTSTSNCATQKIIYLGSITVVFTSELRIQSWRRECRDWKQNRWSANIKR